MRSKRSCGIGFGGGVGAGPPGMLGVLVFECGRRGAGIAPISIGEVSGGLIGLSGGVPPGL